MAKGYKENPKMKEDFFKFINIAANVLSKIFNFIKKEKCNSFNFI